MFDECDLAEISSPDFPGERLIVCRNPVLADQRHRKRQEMLAATEKELVPIVKATGRAKEPLRGAAAIGMRVGKVIDQRKMSKHFITEISDDSFSYRRDLEKIAAEEELDGLYIVRSNVEPELFDSEQTVMAYQDLAKVERAFRSMKTVDLKVRPIYHRTAQRVRAHVLLCMLATVRTATGDRLRVLVEVQKARFTDPVMRFREYLGRHYADRGNYDEASDGSRRHRPLRAIYILGECLPHTTATVLRVAREYPDGVTGQRLADREEFVEALSHDCWVVQVPLLASRRRTDLERLLSVFDQERRVAGERGVLEIDERELPERYAPVLRRLAGATASEEVADSMALEDEITETWGRMKREKDAALAEKDTALAEKDAAVARAAELERRLAELGRQSGSS